MGETAVPMEAFLAGDDAYSRSEMGRSANAHTKKEGFVNPLGMEDKDWFVHNVLSCAGITVECLGGAQEEEMKYIAVQIVDELDLNRAMDATSLQEIRYCDMDDMLGLQVKLSGQCKWKVSILEENVEQHGIGQAGRAARGRAAQAAKATSIENLHCYEISVVVPSGGGGAKCTVAFARDITINIYFKYTENLNVRSSIWKNDLPVIQQRRIDMLFTNKYVTSVQVLWNVERNAAGGLWIVARFHVCCVLLCSGRLVRRGGGSQGHEERIHNRRQRLGGDDARLGRWFGPWYAVSRTA